MMRKQFLALIDQQPAWSPPELLASVQCSICTSLLELPREIAWPKQDMLPHHKGCASASVIMSSSAAADGCLLTPEAAGAA